MAEYRKLVEEGASDRVHRAWRRSSGSTARRPSSERRSSEAEALVSEWSGPPDVDAALDFYTELVDLVQGRIQQGRGCSRTAAEALHQVLAGLWAEIEEDRDRLLVEFELVGQPRQYVTPGGDRCSSRRPTLPPRLLDDRMDPEPLAKPGPKPSCRSTRRAPQISA